MLGVERAHQGRQGDRTRSLRLHQLLGRRILVEARGGRAEHQVSRVGGRHGGDEFGAAPRIDHLDHMARVRERVSQGGADRLGIVAGRDHHPLLGTF